MPRAIVSLVRPAHWTKNVFVFAPVVFARLATDLDSLLRSTLAFVAFCAAASAVYVYNDIRDREEDRRHPMKSRRPLAAGTITVASAAAVGVVLAVGAVAAGAALGTAVAVVIVVYIVLNVLYSAALKQVVILDVMIVSLGFVLRVEGGGFAVGVAVSDWLLLCTIFLALFLVFSKRRHELLLLDDDAHEQRQVLSLYSAAFLDSMINVVTASSVVCYALYCVSESRTLVYTVPFVLFGIFRYLFLIYQRPTDRTPTEALIKDRPFLINMALWAALLLWIFYGT